MFNLLTCCTDKSLTVVTQYFTNEQVQEASAIKIQLEKVRFENQAYKVEDGKQFIRGFQLSGCPIHELNGVYLEKGFFTGVPKYEHVRKWTIMRCELPEIEELGISASDTYELANNNQSRLQKFYSKAGMSIYCFTPTPQIM